MCICVYIHIYIYIYIYIYNSFDRALGFTYGEKYVKGLACMTKQSSRSKERRRKSDSGNHFDNEVGFLKV